MNSESGTFNMHITYLFPAQLHVLVLIDLLEHVGGRRGVSDVDQLDVEHQSGSSGDDISGSAVSVAQLWRDGQLTLFT